MNDEARDTGAEEADSVGVRLSRAREAKGLQLEEAAEAMHLSPDALADLEADCFDTLGAQVFVKGHLRQYAHLLDIDADAIIEGYAQQDHPSDEPFVGVLAEPIKVRDDGQLRVMVAGGVGVALLLALFLWWWANPAETQPIAASEPEPTAPLQTETARPVVVPEPVADPPSVVPEQSTPAEQRDAEGIASTFPEAATAGATVSSDPATLAVEVIFAEDCWAEIFGGDDQRLFYGLGRAGARSRFTATPPMTVLLGNAGAVEISVNGQAYPIPAGARQGNLARFVVVDAP